MIKYINSNNSNSKSNQFANDQIIHHIAVSSTQSQQSIGYQNHFHGLNEMVSTQVNSNLINHFNLNTNKSTNQSNQVKQIKKRNNSLEKENKILEVIN